MKTISIYIEKPAWVATSVLSLGFINAIIAELILVEAITSIDEEINMQMIGHLITSLTAFFFMLLEPIW